MDNAPRVVTGSMDHRRRIGHRVMCLNQSTPHCDEAELASASSMGAGCSCHPAG
jgi:hypothetical protein